MTLLFIITLTPHIIPIELKKGAPKLAASGFGEGSA